MRKVLFKLLNFCTLIKIFTVPIDIFKKILTKKESS